MRWIYVLNFDLGIKKKRVRMNKKNEDIWWLKYSITSSSLKFPGASFGFMRDELTEVSHEKIPAGYFPLNPGCSIGIGILIS